MIPRDTIGIKDFLWKTQEGFREIAQAYDLWEPDDTCNPPDWAAFWFILRQLPDEERFFPSGKWATIQRLEELLNEWAQWQWNPELRKDVK